MRRKAKTKKNKENTSFNIIDDTDPAALERRPHEQPLQVANFGNNLQSGSIHPTPQNNLFSLAEQSILPDLSQIPAGRELLIGQFSGQLRDLQDDFAPAPQNTTNDNNNSPTSQEVNNAAAALSQISHAMRLSTPNADNNNNNKFVFSLLLMYFFIFP